MLIMSVIIIASESVTAKTIETMKGPNAPDQLQVGRALNFVTNKIYVLSPLDGTVKVLDSKSGTVKNIPVGTGYPASCLYCIGVDFGNNKIYEANCLILSLW
jgi:DNA-binding beta-propeller fold protein YncE